MQANQIEALEIELLLETLVRRYGYDFRAYARSSITRRVQQFLLVRGLKSPAALIPLVLHDADLFSDLAQQFSVTVSEMFRDPEVYLAIRQEVVPVLRTYPLLHVWHAGCAAGQEVYSMAILLFEAGLLERSTLFGTDFNDQILATARRGVYPAEQFATYTTNYQRAGGKAAFSEYYRSHYGSAALEPFLGQNVTFANHNLVTDGVFSEVNLVVCRNVLIYFDRELQDRALRVFTNSLMRGGFLVLGSRETLRFSGVAEAYENVNEAARIYRKVDDRVFEVAAGGPERAVASGATPVEAIVLGGSNGALDPVLATLEALPHPLPVPIVVVFHLVREGPGHLRALLSQRLSAPVVDVEDKCRAEPGTVYLAPPNHHVLVEPDGRLSLSVDDPVHFSRPSIDVLFETAARTWGTGLVGVLYSGANADGAVGLETIQAYGGRAIVQDPRTALSAEMPSAALGRVPDAEVLGPAGIGERLSRFLEERR